ncbi:hypothetical protein EES37_36855 [Streptomyces sp. ADI91-18]|nr:hypothetical protein [Streptomyces sp. ADI91-18]RPK27491.1 hypothetical protein EES37_36855 [Streptomyces sp. ADI91-18]
MVLTPPFELMLDQAAAYVPGSGVLASGFAAEQKLWTGLSLSVVQACVRY